MGHLQLIENYFQILMQHFLVLYSIIEQHMIDYISICFNYMCICILFSLFKNVTIDITNLLVISRYQQVFPTVLPCFLFDCTNTFEKGSNYENE